MPAQYLQCGANSDCILSDGGCSSPTAVNGNYDAAWRAQLAAASPTCQAYTSAMMQQLAQTNVPVCIANQCAIQLIQPVSNQ